MEEYVVVMDGKVNTNKYSEEQANKLAEYIKRVFQIECEVKRV
jgi:hypothetical protein